jgi:hypothetical protein
MIIDSRTMMDDEMYIVLKVEAHTFIGNKRKIKDNLELFMQFEDDTEPMWYGWNSSYNDVPVIQEYFKKKQNESLHLGKI